jgi:hypothetical protein
MSENGRSWRRVGRGLLVIGIGCFLLLNTTGFLPWSFWFDLIPFWPVLLVALGVRLLFERSRVPAALLLSPVLILGTMTWVAVSGPAHLRWSGRSLAVRAERPEGVERWTLQGSVVYGSLDMVGRVLDPSVLVEGTARYSRQRPEVRTTTGRGAAKVRFRPQSRRHVFGLASPWMSWELDVAEDLPVAMDLEAVLSDVRLDLPDVPLSTLEADGAFNRVEAVLGEPSREVFINVKGAFSRYSFAVPAQVPVRVDSDGAFNYVTGERGGRLPGYRVRLDGAFNRVSVSSR